jgi:hypothetical protein
VQHAFSQAQVASIAATDVAYNASIAYTLDCFDYPAVNSVKVRFADRIVFGPARVQACSRYMIMMQCKAFLESLRRSGYRVVDSEGREVDFVGG